MKLTTIGATAALLMLSSSPAALAATDEEFLKTAIGINLAEIDMGEMASEKGESSEVKTFGQTLIDDHMKANEEAKKLAATMKIEAPTEPSDEAKKAAEDIGGKQGADFDKAFADHMVMGHEEAIALFKDKADDADNDVSTFAKNTLPTLEAHLKTAQSIADQTGDQTASSSTPPAASGQATTSGSSGTTTADSADQKATPTGSEQTTQSNETAATSTTTTTTPSATAQNEPATAPAATPPATTTEPDATATARPEGLKPVETGTISSENLVGTTVYGVNDDTLGEVGDVILAKEGTEGSIEAIVVDVGGFLGIGAKPVALALSDLEIMTDADGDYYVYSKFSKEQLENAPDFDKATFDQDRDRIILRSTQ
jgi:predicted outer membrane protein